MGSSKSADENRSRLPSSYTGLPHANQTQQYNVMSSLKPTNDDSCCGQVTGATGIDVNTQHINKLKLCDFPKNILSGPDPGRPTTPDSCYYEPSTVEFSRLHQRNINLEEKSVQQQQLILELQAKNSNMEKRIYDQDSRIKEMRELMSEFEARNCQGVYIWKIPKYTQLRNRAIKGEASVLHSAGFYSDLYGYKICIRMNLNGVDTGQSTHLSVFVHFMQGQFDDLLEWPFRGKITLSILDQNEKVDDRQHITETLVSKPSLAAFQRPRSFRNHKGFGYIEFAPFSVISEHSSYLKNDTLTVKAVIVT